MKKINLIIYILFVFSLVVGCSTPSVKKLKQNSAGQYSFVANKNYKVVYRITSNYFDKANSPGSVHTRLYLDKKEAKVYRRISGLLNPTNITLACEMRAMNKNKTSVKIFYLYSPWKDEALSIKKAILDKNEGS